MHNTKVSPAVAITGIGMTLPTGCSLDSLWDRWCTQTPAFSPFRSNWIKTDRIRYFSAVSDADHALARECLPHKLRRYGTNATYLGVRAAGLALHDAGVELGACAEGRYGLYTAQGDYTAPSFNTFRTAVQQTLLNAGAGDSAGAFDLRRLTEESLYRRGMDPFVAVKGLANNLLALTSLTYRFRGEGGAFVQNESAAYAALHSALFSLREGYCDLALIAAAGSYNEVWTLAEHWHLGHLGVGRQQEYPVRAFDCARGGTVLGEGAVALVLESMGHARQRGARVLARIAGLGSHASAPGRRVPDDAYTHAMARACRGWVSNGQTTGCAGLETVDAMLVDGKGTIAHDRHEARLLRHAFDAAQLPERRAIPLTTVRPITGLVPAAGPLADVALAARMLQAGRIPPIPGLQDPEDRELGFVQHHAIDRRLRRILAMQQGFTGFCSAIAVEQADHYG